MLAKVDTRLENFLKTGPNGMENIETVSAIIGGEKITYWASLRLVLPVVQTCIKMIIVDQQQASILSQPTMVLPWKIWFLITKSTMNPTERITWMVKIIIAPGIAA